MWATNRDSLFTSSLAAMSLLMLGSDVMADITGPGRGMMGYGSMHGFGWMWVPWLLVVVLGAALFASMFRRR